MSEPEASKKVVPDGSSKESEAPEAHPLFSPKFVLISRVIAVLCILAVGATYAIDGYIDYSLLFNAGCLGWLYPSFASQHLVINDEENRAKRRWRMVVVGLTMFVMVGSVVGWSFLGADWFQVFSVERAYAEADAGRMKSAEWWMWAGVRLHPRDKRQAPFAGGVLRIWLGVRATNAKNYSQAEALFAEAVDAVRPLVASSRGQPKEFAQQLLAECLRHQIGMYPGRVDRQEDLAVLDEICALTEISPLPPFKQGMLLARRGLLRRKRKVAGAEEDIAAAKALLLKSHSPAAATLIRQLNEDAP